MDRSGRVLVVGIIVVVTGLLLVLVIFVFLIVIFQEPIDRGAIFDRWADRLIV